MLIGGDHYTDSRGIPVPITGDRELLQQALLRLSIKKGGFKEDPTLGSELYKLKNFQGESLTRLAQSYAQEALLSMPEVSVSSVDIYPEGNGIIRLHITLDIARNIYRLEVDVV